VLTIIMYHYVRDLPRSRYPRIKGLATEKFDGQLDYVMKHYNICSQRQVVAAAAGQAELPPRACLLTFDDGFADHYQTVLPRLLQRKITGSFYPSAQVVEERRVLDVHKLQFILASAADTDHLIADVFKLLVAYRSEFEIPDDQSLRATYTSQSRFDPPQVVFVKRLLQHGLPERVRAEIIASLFAEYVSRDERTFANELYMDIPQLQRMIADGMDVGGHGYTHRWLEHLSPAEQAEEIQRTLSFLAGVRGGPPSDWAMCYPFGSYNAITLQLLAASGCRLGLTTHVTLNNDLSRPLELGRLDTNGLPFCGGGDLSAWTEAARAARSGKEV
jgi:peptidoglycan/xylan/chitin deacetylase (PgdA/CDA1 family)